MRQWLTDVAPVGQAALQTVSDLCYRQSRIKYPHELTALSLGRLFGCYMALCQQMKLHSVDWICDWVCKMLERRCNSITYLLLVTSRN